MKRSEMVINIAIEMMSRLPEWEKQERLNFASEILQVCEMEGMVPVILPEDADHREITDAQYIFNNWKWEPEE